MGSVRGRDYTLGLIPFAALALARLSDFVEGDTFWGVRTGQQIVATHSAHLYDDLSWTRSGVPWRPNEWGYDVALWLAYRLDGMVGLQLFVAATILLLGGVLLAAVRAFQADVRDVFWLGLFSSPLLLGWLSARAQTVSYSLQLLELLLLARLFAAQGRAIWRWAAALLALQLAWVNVHEAALSGAAVALGSAAVRGFTLIRTRNLAWRSAAQVAAGPVIVLVGSLGGPFGWGVFGDSERTRAASAGLIVEWDSIVTATLGVRLEIVAAVVMLLVVALVWHGERGTALESLTDVWLGAALVLAAASLFAVRFVAPLVIIELVAVVTGVGIERIHVRVTTYRRLLTVGAAVVAGAFVVIGVHELTLAGEPTASTFPSAALVESIPANCQLLNQYNDGGWISLLRGPSLRISQDGRNVLYGRSVLEHEGLLLGGRQGVAGVASFGATCVLAAPSEGIVHELAADPQWVLAGRDSKRVLYERRSAG
jgi:hypothetical protein